MARHTKIPGLKQDDDGVWIVRVKVKDASGKWRLVQRSTRETDRKAAETKALEIRAEILRNPPEPGPAKPKERPRVELEVYAAKDIAENIRKGVTEIHSDRLEARWEVILRNAPTTDMTKIDYDWMRGYEGLRRKDGIKGQTIVREAQAVKRALKIAYRQGKLERIPDEWPKIRKDPKDKAKSGKFWAPQILAGFVATLHQDARDEVWLDVMTGLRATELIATVADGAPDRIRTCDPRLRRLRSSRNILGFVIRGASRRTLARASAASLVDVIPGAFARTPHQPTEVGRERH